MSKSTKMLCYAAMFLALGLGGAGFTWQMFMAGALLNAIPGIILHLILLPTIMVALHRTGLVPFRKESISLSTQAQ